MFADYRVPVVLRQLGILQYSDQLASKVTQSTISLISPESRSLLCFQHCQSHGSPLSVSPSSGSPPHPNVRKALAQAPRDLPQLT